MNPGDAGRGRGQRLDAETRASLRYALLEDPRLPNTMIAGEVGVTDKTVARVRALMTASGEIEEVFAVAGRRRLTEARGGSESDERRVRRDWGSEEDTVAVVEMEAVVRFWAPDGSAIRPYQFWIGPLQMDDASRDRGNEGLRDCAVKLAQAIVENPKLRQRWRQKPSRS